MIMKTRATAIVLAAGYSSRMGKFKPLLPLGETTVLGRVITLFRDAGFSDIRIVVGYRSEELLPLLGKMGVPYIVNQNFHAGMFSSVVAGVKGLEKSTDAFFILPVDIPLIRPWTARLLYSPVLWGQAWSPSTYFSLSRRPNYCLERTRRTQRGFGAIGG